MTANLQGVRFDQIYADNNPQSSSEQTLDTDGDGTATQEDEFVSITNDSGAPLDVSGWQIWSDSTGYGAPDTAQDGLYHTFPPGTVLKTGQTLHIINEISGPVPPWAQEASEGGVESGSGGVSTNLLSEGNVGSHDEAIALVNPATGDYIVFNMSSDPPAIQNLPGFPGTNNVGTVDGSAVSEDPTSGVSYRYHEPTGTYRSEAASIPCFASGCRIDTPRGPVAVEALRIGDKVLTEDAGPQPVRWIGMQHLNADDLRATGQYPIEFKPGSLGPGAPTRSLQVSPQHRLLLAGLLVPARGITDLPSVRVMWGRRQVTYHHVLLSQHHVIRAEGAKTESLLPGRMFLAGRSIADQLEIMRIAGPDPKPARSCLTVGQARALVAVGDVSLSG
ncbi:Hint domain-containing protein [uncultured Roseobacter sp.]|uniref:Hint domain-containing protein n=1 Tax=uncultured Roseobacter sp. TaxID=114847 RepID=UPI002629F544|nr:Hint domain-containing protein [uncultured Roseobacter sp.]